MIGLAVKERHDIILTVYHVKGTNIMQESILVVDDEKEIADLLEVYLKNEGYHVYKFYEGTSALECIQNSEISLAVLDIMLPDMDGLTLLRKIREQYFFPVIMLTARVEEMDKITGLTLGADDYITKPFQPLEVVARIKTQLRRYTTYNQSTVSFGSDNLHTVGYVFCIYEDTADSGCSSQYYPECGNRLSYDAVCYVGCQQYS